MVFDLIIIGSGPAGITAGIYAARKKMKTLLIAKDFLGQVGKTFEIDNWPGSPNIKGAELIGSFEKHLRKFEVTIEEKEVFKIEKKDDYFFINEDEFASQTMIVATGATPRRLKVAGETEFLGKGVSYCSICDAPFFKDKKVAIVGGGNCGFEAALDLKIYAKEVYIIEKTNRIIADKILQDKANQKGIKVLLNEEIREIKGDAMVESIDLLQFEMDIDGVFVEIGHIPASYLLKDLVELNKKDEIIVDPETLATNVKGLFAPGDVNNLKYKQIITAASEGARSALSAFEYLKNV